MDPALILRDLAEGRSRGIARSQRIGRAVRMLTFGMARTGEVEAAKVERLLVEAVQAARPRPRVVAVLSGSGGTGTTTTAAGIAATMAALRDDAVVLVDAQTGTGSLAARMPGVAVQRAVPTAWDLAVRGERAVPRAQQGRPAVVDAAPRGAPMTPYHLERALDALAARYTFLVLDLGDDAGALAGLADRVVVVTVPAEAAVDGARRALDRVGRCGPEVAETAAVAVVCREPAAHRRLVRRLHEELSADVARLVLVPYDRALDGPGLPDPVRLRPATREAYLALAALAAG
ncbi:hypothetical protein [Dactylosporangium sp. CA-092794]|uniref:hypothetical protein n=1 Tax=Dactylosporangium sp. CA-092794 TaxID=3239929 RepID=UPI003D8F38AC